MGAVMMRPVRVVVARQCAMYTLMSRHRSGIQMPSLSWSGRDTKKGDNWE